MQTWHEMCKTTCSQINVIQIWNTIRILFESSNMIRISNVIRISNMIAISNMIQISNLEYDSISNMIRIPNKYHVTKHFPFISRNILSTWKTHSLTFCSGSFHILREHHSFYDTEPHSHKHLQGFCNIRDGQRLLRIVRACKSSRAVNFSILVANQDTYKTFGEPRKIPALDIWP